MNGHEGGWLEEWLDEFLARTSPGWPFETPSFRSSRPILRREEQRMG